MTTPERPTGDRVPFAFRTPTQTFDFWADTAHAVGRTPADLIRAIVGDTALPATETSTTNPTQLQQHHREIAGLRPVVFRVSPATAGRLTQAAQESGLGVNGYMEQTIDASLRRLYTEAGLDPDAEDASTKLRERQDREFITSWTTSLPTPEPETNLLDMFRVQGSEEDRRRYTDKNWGLFGPPEDPDQDGSTQ